MSPMHAPPSPDTDSAIVLGMASTAMAFAASPEAEAERWLRILRLHGRAGVALQALGVSEAPLEAGGAPDAGARPDPARADGLDVVSAVTERAVASAGRRGAQMVDTSDVLVAVMDVYGEDFDRVLRMHGTDRREVLERLGAELPGPADG
jgi:hypothetical protein